MILGKYVFIQYHACLYTFVCSFFVLLLFFFFFFFFLFALNLIIDSKGGFNLVTLITAFQSHLDVLPMLEEKVEYS